MSIAYSSDLWRHIWPLIDAWNGLKPHQRALMLSNPTHYHEIPFLMEGMATFTVGLFYEKNLKQQDRASMAGKKMLQLAGRCERWSAEGTFNLDIYLGQMTTLTERQIFGKAPSNVAEIQRAWLTQQIQAGNRIADFFKLKSEGTFSPEIQNWMKGLGDPFGVSDQKALLNWMIQLDSKEVNHFAEPSFTISPQLLKSTHPDFDWPLFIFWATRFLLLFPYLDANHGLVFRFYPSQKNQSNASTALNKIPAKDEEILVRPFLVQDIQTMLRELASDPVPLLSDGEYAPIAYYRRVGKRLVPLEAYPNDGGFLPEFRARNAWTVMANSNFFTTSGRSYRNQKAEISDEGKHWLTLPADLQWDICLKSLPIGRSMPRNHIRIYQFMGDFGILPLPYRTVSDFVFSEMDKAIKDLGTEAIEFTPWLQSFCERSNPFIFESQQSPELTFAWRQWRTKPTDAFRDLLLHYIAHLASLGAIGFCRIADEKLGIAFTSVGEFVFGLADEYHHDNSLPKAALIGPDFTITLMEASARVVDAIKPFTEQVSSNIHRPGAAFRVNQTSIQSATSHGFKVESIISTLNEISKNGVPENVEKQIHNWVEKKTHIRYQEAVLIEGDDPVNMAELRSQFPKDFDLISPTILRYLGKSKRAALLEKLRKKGYFLA